MTRFPPVPVVCLLGVMAVALVFVVLWAAVSATSHVERPPVRRATFTPASWCARGGGCVPVEDQYVIVRGGEVGR